MSAEQSVLVQKSEKFVEYFNQNDSKSIHQMFSVEMKAGYTFNAIGKNLISIFKAIWSYYGKGVY